MTALGDKLTDMLAAEGLPSRSATVSLVLQMALPGILAEVSTTVMQYIDTGMVGSLGALATAAVGLVETTTWLIFGFCECAAQGFTIQIAQYLGAGEDQRARDVMCQGLITCGIFSVLLALVGMGISGMLPGWLGGAPEIADDASGYFFWISAFAPTFMAQRMGSLLLQCEGDMVTPSALNTLSCPLDVIFNMMLIRKGTTIGFLQVPGLGLGVRGAALGTCLATLVAALVMLWCALVRDGRLALRRGVRWQLSARCQREAGAISAPLFLERIVMNGAYIAQTVIVAPLGTDAVAANSLATIAESACYMPGMGISQAATTLVGQAFGSHRRDLSKRFANYSTALGMVLMGSMAAVLWIICPPLMAMLTPDAGVAALACEVLRTEMFAEPLYGADMVASGALRGAGDTLGPSLINFGSMWAIRLTLAAVLVPRLGLVGMWLSMCVELNCRGTFLLIRLLRGRWLERSAVTEL